MEQHRAQQDAKREYLGDSWTETGHIFVSTLGTLLGQRGVTRLSHSLQEKAGVPRARLHNARHMHVSLLVKSKVDPSAVADRLGHADPAFTLRQYSHVFEEQRRAAALSLDTLLGDKVEDKGSSEDVKEGDET